MLRRHDLPALTGDLGVTLDTAMEHLRLWHADTLDTIETLRSYAQQVEQNAARLENPGAVIEYIDFFADLLGRLAVDLDRVRAELPTGITRAHVDGLRQLASNSAVEQRRCVIFRDKWVNKILPYEQMRPLLDQISVTTREQLAEYRELTAAASILETLAGNPGVPATDASSGDNTLDRRALFNRLFKR